MTTTYSPAASGSRFSWQRVGQLYAYWSPQIRNQLIIYFLISLIDAIIILMPVHNIAHFMFYTLVSGTLPYLYCLAPCIFTRYGDTRIVENLIPATAAEKLTFFASYLLLVVWCAIYILPEVAFYIYPHLGYPDDTLLSYVLEANRIRTWLTTWFNAFVAISSALLCLYIILSAKTHRALKAVLSVIGYQLVAGFIAGIITSAIKSELSRPQTVVSGSITETMRSSLMDGLDQAKEAANYFNGSDPIFLIYTILITILAIVLLWGCYAALSRRKIWNSTTTSRSTGR